MPADPIPADARALAEEEIRGLSPRCECRTCTLARALLAAREGR